MISVKFSTKKPPLFWIYLTFDKCKTYIISPIIFWKVFFLLSCILLWDNFYFHHLKISSLSCLHFFIFNFVSGTFWLVYTFQTSLSITLLIYGISDSLNIFPYSILTSSYSFWEIIVVLLVTHFWIKLHNFLHSLTVFHN